MVVYFRVKQGTLRKGQTIRMMATGAEYTILECGYLKPLGNEPTDALQAGEVGYFTASIKDVRHTQVGDTVTLTIYRDGKTFDVKVKLVDTNDIS